MMYLDLFDPVMREQRPSSGQTFGGQHLDHIKDVMRHNLDGVKKYYASRSFVISGDNPLLKVLDQVTMHLKSDDALFLDFVQRQADYYARNAGISSGIDFGRIHHSKFFTDSEAILFSIQQRVGLSDLAASWRTYPCLKYYRLPWEHMGLYLPVNDSYPSCPGLSVIGIDIPALIMKYRFYLQEAYRNGTTIHRGVFLSKYVYPMAMEDLIDHMFLNRIIRNLLGGDEVPCETNKQVPNQHQFGRSEIHFEVSGIKKIIQRNAGKRYEELLEDIPLIFAKNALELLALPEVAVTTQSKLLLLMSRLDYLPVLMSLSKDSTVNNQHHNGWKRLCKQLLRDNQLSRLESLSPVLYESTKEKMNVVMMS